MMSSSMSCPSISGIIFDVDGVLFDTEPLHVKAWLQTAGKIGFELTEGDLVPWTGKPCSDLAEFLSERNGRTYTGNYLLTVKEEIFRNLLASETFFDERIRSLLERVSQEIPLTWATSSPGENIKLMFRKTGIIDLFHPGVCIEDVSRPKPDPESYRKAAEKIGLRPEECLALDDSPSGVASALGAGCVTLGIEGAFNHNVLSGVYRTFPSTEKALHWIINMS